MKKESDYNFAIRQKLGNWIKRCQSDFSFFLFECCKTNDPHDSANPVKYFPKYPFLVEIAKIFPSVKKLIFAKARQMLISWICCAYILWDIMFHPYKKWFIVSKKEETANEILDRVKFLFEHLPHFLKDRWTVERNVYCKFQLMETKGVVTAVSQDADALRTFTASGIFSDEMAFQPFAGKAYRGYMPTIEKAQFIGVSTPNGKNFFYKLYADNREE